MTMIARRILLAAFLAVATATGAAAQWPSKPVRLVVPFPAGGSTDVVGRIVAAKLSDRLGQQVVVDNRGGASGTIGSEVVARSPADGYTLVLSNIGSQGIGPALFTSVKYDTAKDFAHVAMIGTFTNVLIVHPSLPARTLGEFVEAARREPARIHFATSGNGSSNHLLGEMLKLAAGIDMVHIPYRGAGPALNDLVANQIPAMFDSLPSAAGHVKAGSARALAVASATRLEAMPDVPTFAEAGYSGLVIDNWFGLSGPAGMPAEAVEKLSREMKVVLEDAETRRRLLDLGLDTRWMAPAPFAAFIAADLGKWKDVVTRAKVSAQ